MTARAALAMAMFAVAGCSQEPLPPLGQIRLFVDTDAPLPPAAGEADDDQPAIFDRLRIEVFSPGEAEPCAGCTREFGVDERTVLEGRASVGIAATPGRDGYLARVRLYRSGGADVVEPRPASTLDAVLSLPVVGAEGIIDVHTVLWSDDLGTPHGTLDAPAPADPGPATGGLAGTFGADHRRDCDGSPAPDEVCVRGGAYWMGDLTIGNTYGSVSSERLVVVSSFYIGSSEVSVASYRASSVDKKKTVFSRTKFAECTYTDQPSTFEMHPLNCVTREGAELYCGEKGARLPTEAEWEFVASGRRSALTVWGDDPPSCTDATFARSDDAGATAASKECVPFGAGTLPIGSGALDRFELPGGAIVDLAGSLTEWMGDAWAEQGTPCWSKPLLYDPVCTQGTKPPGYVVRGASYQHPKSELRAALRAMIDATGGPLSAQIGFRCVRDAK